MVQPVDLGREADALTGISERVTRAGFAESLLPEQTAIALAARQPLRRRVVATVRERIVNAEGNPSTNDLGFGHCDQRRVNLESRLAFDAGLSGEIGHALEGFDVFGPAVGITTLPRNNEAERTAHECMIVFNRDVVQ